jgi:pimeloyl-ACP methyl ester carboxylesterase
MGWLATEDGRRIHFEHYPVLSIGGAKDVVVSPDVCRAAARIARYGQVLEFAESGHAPHLEEGPRYRAALLDFLSALG